MSDLEDALAKHRAELAAGERSAHNRMVRAYGHAWNATSRDLERVLAKLSDAIDAGEPVSPSWFSQSRRLEVTLARLEAGMRTFAAEASLATRATQAAAVDAAQAHARELLEVQVGELGIAATFDAMPEEALRDLVGFAADGSPLRAVFLSMGPDAGAALERSLAAGIARGLSPRQMVAEARHAVGGQLARALTIARTETMRAYRESSRRSYADNPQAVAGWSWGCACDRRSCAACWAMHGREFPATETLDGHPNCRCAMIPVPRSMAELGLGDAGRPTHPTGAERFAELDLEEQAAIVGRRKAEAIAAGELELGDLVGRPTSARWGTMRRERSLTEARRSRAAGAGDADHRLGAGIPAPTATELGRARRAHLGHVAAAEELALAEAAGVSVAELREARALIRSYKDAAKAEALETAEAAWQLLDRLEVTRPFRPPPLQRVRGPNGQMVSRRLVDRGNGLEDVGGEWDWLETLSEAERKRVGRWFRAGDDTQASREPFADQLADELGRIMGGDWDADSAARWWMDQTALVDGGRSIAAGRVPAYVDVGDLTPGLRADGIDAARLFRVSDDDAASYLAQRLAELEADRAIRVLGTAGDYTHGPPPWRMSSSAYRDELVDVEQRLRAARFGEPDPDAAARWWELVPDGEDRDHLGELLAPEELHERFLRLARLAELP